jgi:hypothetical protein
MNRYAILEAKRLLNRAHEVSPEAAALAVQAMQQFAEARINPSDVMYYVNEALPGVVQTKKEKELLAI